MEKKRKGFFIYLVGVLFFMLLLPIVLLAMIVMGFWDFRFLLIACAILSFVWGVVLLFKAIKSIQTTRTRLPYVAAGLDLACPILLWLAPYASNLSSAWALLGILFILFGILAPVVGVVAGLQGFVEAKKAGDRVGMLVAFLAVVIPLIALAYTIVMFSTGVWVIRFM